MGSFNETWRKVAPRLKSLFTKLESSRFRTYKQIAEAHDPGPGVYIFFEGNKKRPKAVYVGRTKSIQRRIRQHGASRDSATLAFKMARKTRDDWKAIARKDLWKSPDFRAVFKEKKREIRGFSIKYVQTKDAVRQALLEIFATIQLRTPYNDWETH